MTAVEIKKQDKKKSGKNKVPNKEQIKATLTEIAVASVTNKSQQEFVVPMVEDKDGVPVPALSREHLLEAELLLSKTEAAQAKSRDMHKGAELTEQTAILQVRAMRQEAMRHESAAQQLIMQRREFWDKMATLYGIDFAHAGYDDQTGVITVDTRREQKQTQ